MKENYTACNEYINLLLIIRYFLDDLPLTVSLNLSVGLIIKI